jgi:hypothetical protein
VGQECPTYSSESKSPLLATGFWFGTEALYLGAVTLVCNGSRFCYAGRTRDNRRDAGATGNMHRLTARFLLLFVLVGNFVPLALAVAAGQAHACCVRKAAHPCHGGGILESSQLTIHDASCCNHDCCRAVTTAHWAHPQPRTASLCREVISRVVEFRKNAPVRESFALQLTRAPPLPYCSLA